MESMAAGHSSTGNENSGTQLINFSSDDRWFMDEIFSLLLPAHTLMLAPSYQSLKTRQNSS